MTHFDVEGFTVARNEGFNGYKPEIAIVDGRKPVWRDPISLARILEKDMSKHVFLSPDGKYSADTSMKTVYYNRYILGQWCNAEGLIFQQIARSGTDFLKLRPILEKRAIVFLMLSLFLNPFIMSLVGRMSVLDVMKCKPSLITPLVFS